MEAHFGLVVRYLAEQMIEIVKTGIRLIVALIHSCLKSIKPFKYLSLRLVPPRRRLSYEGWSAQDLEPEYTMRTLRIVGSNQACLIPKAFPDNRVGS